MRVLQFKNSIMNMKCYPANGEYCVIGYFDALDTYTDEDLSVEERIRLLSDPNMSKLTAIDEICDYYTVIGLTDEDDASFWDDPSMPLIFISCIRGKGPLSDVVLDENTKKYTTIDSSDVVICHKCASYIEGQKTLQQIQSKICSSAVLIAFSVVAIRQAALDCMVEGIVADEEISCLEKCFVKDRIESHKFVNSLKDMFGQRVSCHEIIGTDDMLISIERIKLSDWLSLYKKNGILTHLYYSNAFYNIQSNVLPCFESISEELYCQPVEKPLRTDDQTLVQAYISNSKDDDLGRSIKKVIKLRWAYVKTKENDLVAYLSRILDRTYPMFENYFLERVGAYKEDPDEHILWDIDISIEAFWEAEDAILHTTNAADRIVIQTAAIDTGLRYVGPKLCYYYSEMLRELGKIFYPEESYGFIVSPTVRDTTTAMVLFRTNTNHGKISSIRISENSIADVWTMNILLLHEFYHICPAELRLRKERAKQLIKVLTYDILDSVSNGIEKNDQMLSYMTNAINDSCLAELKDQQDDSRDFYGENVLEIISDSLIKNVASWLNITTDQIMIWFSSWDYNRNYESYKQAQNKANEISEKLRNNILGILGNSRITLISKSYMSAFREAYCDLMGVLSLRIMPQAFIDSFDYKLNDQDMMDDCAPVGLRLYFVLQTITFELPQDIVIKLKENDANNADKHKMGIYFFNEWLDWKNSLTGFNKGTIKEALHEMEQLTSVGREPVKIASKDEEKLELFRNTAMLDEYIDYFVACRNNYLRYMLVNQERFDRWNQKYMIQDNVDTFDIIRTISMRTWETY